MAVIEARPTASIGASLPHSPASWPALAAMEVRAGVRGPAFRFLVVLAIILGMAVGAAPGRGASLSAWAVGEAVWHYLGFIVIIWMSLAAVHDIATRTDIIVYSKPQPTERLVVSRFAAIYAQLLLVLAAMFGGSMAGRLYEGGSLAGFPVYFDRYLTSGGLVFFIAAVSYSMSLLACTPLAGALL